jgi:hypothetical protein
MRQQLGFAWSKRISERFTLNSSPKCVLAFCEPFELFSNVRHYTSSSESVKHNSSLAEHDWSNCCPCFHVHINFVTLSMILLYSFTKFKILLERQGARHTCKCESWTTLSFPLLPWRQNQSWIGRMSAGTSFTKLTRSMRMEKTGQQFG